MARNCSHFRPRLGPGSAGYYDLEMPSRAEARNQLEIVQKIVEVPEIQILEKIIEVPEIQEVVRQVPFVTSKHTRTEIREIPVPSTSLVWHCLPGLAQSHEHVADVVTKTY